jgi:eukaryotic-like serine/threonine-protein kinase
VFTPADKKGRYLVTLGGPMSREDAILLQQKALAAGLPDDVSVQNYTE